MSMKFPRKDKWETYNCVIKRTNGCSKLDQLDQQGSFVWVSVSRITWVNGSLTYLFKQIASHKNQAHRMRLYLSH